MISDINPVLVWFRFWPPAWHFTSQLTLNVWVFSGKMISKTLILRRRLLWRLRLKLLEREPSSRWRLAWSSSRTCCWKEGSETSVCLRRERGGSDQNCVCERERREGGLGRALSSLWIADLRHFVYGNNLTFPLIHEWSWYKNPDFKETCNYRKALISVWLKWQDQDRSFPPTVFFPHIR